jgi:hypothetical protein
MALQSMTALKSISIEKLMKLKSDVEAMLAQKVSEQRHSLQQVPRRQGVVLGARLLLSIAIPRPERLGQDAD